MFLIRKSSAVWVSYADFFLLQSVDLGVNRELKNSKLITLSEVVWFKEFLSNLLKLLLK